MARTPDKATDYESLAKLIIGRNNALVGMKFGDPLMELRMLRAHIEVNQIMLLNIVDKYADKAEPAKPE